MSRSVSEIRECRIKGNGREVFLIGKELEVLFTSESKMGLEMERKIGAASSVMQMQDCRV